MLAGRFKIMISGNPPDLGYADNVPQAGFQWHFQVIIAQQHDGFGFVLLHRRNQWIEITVRIARK
jgi:hypothetical protein